MTSQMANIIVVLIVGAVAVSAQYRPSYAPNGSMYPRPPSSYEAEESSVVDRSKGGDESSNVPMEDTNLKNQIQSWPREKQPYWFLNAHAINRQIGKTDPSLTSSTSTQPSNSN